MQILYIFCLLRGCTHLVDSYVSEHHHLGNSPSTRRQGPKVAVNVKAQPSHSAVSTPGWVWSWSRRPAPRLGSGHGSTLGSARVDSCRSMLVWMATCARDVLGLAIRAVCYHRVTASRGAVGVAEQCQRLPDNGYGYTATRFCLHGSG